MAGTSPAMTMLGISYASPKPAAVEERAFGDVAPIHDRSTELHVALVDLPGEIIGGPNLGDHVLRDRKKGLEHGVVELQDFHRVFVFQLAKRERVVRVELRDGARVLARSNSLKDPLIAGIKTLPHDFIDPHGLTGTRLVEAR